MTHAPIRTATLALVLLATVFAVTPAPAVAQSQPEPPLSVDARGWGHGVGMGQHGAQGMALGGSSYRQILQYFYTGVSVGAAPSSHTSLWNDVRVRIRSTDEPVEIVAEGNVRLQVPEGSYGGGHVDVSAGERVVISTEGAAMVARVYPAGGSTERTGRASDVAQPTMWVDLDGTPARTRSGTWGELRYRHGEIVVHGGRRDGCAQHCVGVRGMSMNQYLMGLAEMPGSWHLEALRAQAVAGRAYAAPKIAARGANLFHLQDSVLDQAWKGDQGPGGEWPAAVTSTGNEVVTYTGPDAAWNGKIIDAYYSASTGGHTENSEYVWSGVRPWARAKPDPGDGWSGNPHRKTYSYTRDVVGWRLFDMKFA